MNAILCGDPTLKINKNEIELNEIGISFRVNENLLLIPLVDIFGKLFMPIVRSCHSNTSRA